MDTKLNKIISEEERKIKKIQILRRAKERLEVEHKFAQSEKLKEKYKNYLNQTENDIIKIEKSITLDKSVLDSLIGEDNILFLECSNMLTEISLPEEFRTCSNCYHYYFLDGQRITLEDDVYCGKHFDFDPTEDKGVNLILDCRKRGDFKALNVPLEFEEKRAYLEKKLKEVMTRMGYLKK